MARINIEDSLWMDDRFLTLVEKTSNRASAIGAVVLAFKAAQKFWIPNQRPIPSVQFRSLPFASDLLSSGLAEFVEDGEFVYVKGTKEQFSWLLQRSKAGSENKGKKRERKQTKPIRNETEVERVRTSYSSSSSFSISNTNTEEYSVGSDVAKAPSAPAVKSPVGLFVGTYIRAYQERYGQGTRPNLIGKVQGQIKRFVSETPINRACELIQVYCQMDDKWFLTKCHDFGTFLENLNKIGIALDTGSNQAPGTTIDWSKIKLE